VICAGTDGQVSLDDVLGAGCILQEIRRVEP
jgi:phosphosulfolactate phosphohydrolase-like enzyme